MSVEHFLIVWGALTTLSSIIGLKDLTQQPISGLMKVVWILTILYSGPLGLVAYAWSGRKEISSDSIWRRGIRSTAHCYSGCGLGEILGVTITVAVLSLGAVKVAAVTFTLAFVIGMALTVGPLLQDGVDVMEAITDAAISETASITVMEVTAIGLDLYLSGGEYGGPVFWASLVVSLSAGFLAAYPVNLALIRFGVKEGMHDPRMMAEH